MTSTRTPLPPPHTRVATCLWEGGCGWSRALPYPAIQDALLDHWQERHRSETVAGQGNLVDSTPRGTHETAPGSLPTFRGPGPSDHPLRQHRKDVPK